MRDRSSEIEMPGVDQIPSSYWVWLSEEERKERMRKWTWYLICPKCGTQNMLPQWSGHPLSSVGHPREFIQTGFSAYCERCGYEEEVLPLDKDE
jgi:predicted nucleic-acid-binding Zn-ribbon protein